ncbi:MAG: hypothetical protein IK066_03560, partial [Kiritimatiellae bacterium]|nr:hypothetical protein [Kiritimatiellia bacterium]
MKLFSSRLRPLVLPGLAVLLFLAVFALYAPSIRYGFLTLDDTDYVSKNALVLSGLSPRGILDAFSCGFHGSMYVPLLWISYMVDVSLWGGTPSNPAPFHAVNVVFHALDAVLVFFLLCRLTRILSLSRTHCRPATGFPFPPFLLALLWAVHPLRVESVAWITERKDVLSLFFALLSLLAYLRASSHGETADSSSPSTPVSAPRTPGLLGISFSVFCFAASLLVKAALLPFPVLLLLLDLLLFRRPLSIRLLLAKLPWILLAGAATGFTLVAHSASIPAVPIPLRLARLPQTLAYYLRVSVFPVRLTLLEPDPVFSLLPSILSALLLAALLWLAFRCRRTAPAGSLGIFWFFLFLLPFSGLVPIPNAIVVDRFAYVPAIGLSIACLPFFAPAASPAPVRRAAMALAFAAVAILSVLTLRLLPSWRSSDALYARVRRFSPDNRFLAMHDFRHAVDDTGDYATARGIALRALDRNPSDIQFVVCLASCIANLDGPQPAFDFLSDRRPSSGTFFGEWAWEMASLSLRLGRRAEALSFADLADAALPPHAALRGNVARLRTAASSPDLVDALPHYVSQWMTYERADALEFFRRLLAAHPDRPDFLANVAWFLSTSAWSPAPPSEALDCASRALALAGSRPPPELLDTYAAALANASDFPAAAAAEERAVALLPPGSPSL